MPAAITTRLGAALPRGAHGSRRARSPGRGPFLRKVAKYHILSGAVAIVLTILAALGLPPHGNFQGRGDVLDPAYRGAGRPFFFTIQGMTSEDGGLRDGWKYLYNLDIGQARLYDLGTDPGETTDVAAAVASNPSASCAARSSSACAPPTRHRPPNSNTAHLSSC